MSRFIYVVSVICLALSVTGCSAAMEVQETRTRVLGERRDVEETLDARYEVDLRRLDDGRIFLGLHSRGEHSTSAEIYLRPDTPLDREFDIVLYLDSFRCRVSTPRIHWDYASPAGRMALLDAGRGRIELKMRLRASKPVCAVETEPYDLLLVGRLVVKDRLGTPPRDPD